MPTFVIKDIPDWKDAPQRVNAFPLELHDANGERKFVDFTRGWLSRFRPMVNGFVTFRGAEPWASSMAGYSPMEPDSLSVWPIDEKVSAPTAADLPQDSPNPAESLRISPSDAEKPAEIDFSQVIVVPPAFKLTGELPELAPGARLIPMETVELEPAVIIRPVPAPALPEIDPAKVTEAIKAAHRPLSKVPSVLANPIAKEIDVLARGGDLGKLLPTPLTNEERALVRDLRNECTALKTNLDNCAKARDLAEINLTGARQQYQGEQEKVTRLTKENAKLRREKNDLDNQAEFAYSDRKSLEKSLADCRAKIQEMSEQAGKDVLTITELRAQPAGDRANVDATLLRQAQEREKGANERASRVEQLHNGLIARNAQLEEEYAKLKDRNLELANQGREQYDRINAQAASIEHLHDRSKEQAKTIEQLRDELEAANMRADEKELELEDLRANGAAYAELDPDANDRLKASINDMARESAIERLTMSTALGLTREQLETVDAGTLEMLATWESNAELRKLTEYGQTVRYFGASQHTEQATDLNTLLDNSPDRIKAREQADPAPAVPGLNPVHDEPADPNTARIDGLEQLISQCFAYGNLLAANHEHLVDRHEKQAKRIKKLRKQLRAAGVL